MKLNANDRTVIATCHKKKHTLIEKLIPSQQAYVVTKRVKVILGHSRSHTVGVTQVSL